VSLNGASQETTALQSHDNQISGVIQEFSKDLGLWRAYLSEQIPLQKVESDDVNSLTEILKRIRGRFENDASRSSLVKDKDWPALIDGTKGLSIVVRESCRQGWIVFAAALLAQADIVESLIVRTQDNLALLQEYNKLLRDLQVLAKDWENITSVRTFKSKGLRLQELAKALNEFQASDQVKEFLDAVANGGASLDLLTAEVTTWLKEQGIFSKYKIVGGF